MSAFPSAGAGDALPTPEEIETWPTSHLSDAAAIWRTAAGKSKDAFEQHRRNITNAEWEGDANDAALGRVDGDIRVAGFHGEVLTEAASAAEDGLTAVKAAKREAVAALKEAKDDGFTVADDLAVTDARRYDIDTIVERNRAAKEHAENIRWTAEKLVEADAFVGKWLTAKATELQQLRFEGEDDHGDPTVQMADYSFKQSPEPVPPPQPPGPGAADIRSVLDQLPTGSRPGIREVRSPADLQKLAKWMTQDGTEGTNRYGDPAKGGWKDLPDGSKVGERLAAESTGEPALDIDLQSPDGREHWKIHINPESGAEPNIPAPKAPVEAPKAPQVEPGEAPKASVPEAGATGGGSARAPVVEAPATELAPAVKPVPAIEGWGGPSAEPFGPQPVHPPGSIHHPFPILGVDDPAENPRDFEGHS